VRCAPFACRSDSAGRGKWATRAVKSVYTFPALHLLRKVHQCRDKNPSRVEYLAGVFLCSLMVSRAKWGSPTMSYFDWLSKGSQFHTAEQAAEGLKLRAAKKDRVTREQFHIIVVRALHELRAEGYDVHTHKSSRASGGFYDSAVITRLPAALASETSNAARGRIQIASALPRALARRRGD
jgi:hypothetical protein